MLLGAGLYSTPDASSPTSIIEHDVSYFGYLQGVEVQALLDDVRKLKIIAKGHERRIKYLEDRLAAYEDVAACIDDHIDEHME